MRRFKEACIILALSLGLLLLLEAVVRLAGTERTEMKLLTGNSLAVRDSVLGHRNRPGVRVREHGPEFTATYAVDTQGLRVPATDSERVDVSDRLRVLLLGDSFTFGIGNDYEDTWAHHFEQAAQSRGLHIDVLNAGVPAYDTRTEALYLERLLSRLHPDVVVLAFLPNDVFTNRPVEVSSEPQVVVERGEKAQALHSVAWLTRLVAQSDWLYAQLYRRSARGPFFAQHPSDIVAEQFEVTERLLARIHAMCQAQGIPLLVLSIPQQFQVLAEAHDYVFDAIDVRRVDERLGQAARRAGYPWIAALDTLARTYGQDEVPLYYRIDGHLTPRGNQVVGALLADRFVGRLRDLEATERRRGAPTP